MMEAHQSRQSPVTIMIQLPTASQQMVCIFNLIHTYIHTYIHVHTYIYSCTYMHIYIHTYIHTHVCIHNLHTNSSTSYIHTCTRTYIIPALYQYVILVIFCIPLNSSYLVILCGKGRNVVIGVRCVSS